jgi:hypothetical protein
MSSPTVRASVVAAAAAVAVAIAGLIGGLFSAYFQSKSDSEKLQSTILTELVKRSDADRAEHTKRLIQAGVLKDDDGVICRTFVQQGCPIMPAARK